MLFKSFFDANTSREFLLNSSNFKDSQKNNFNCKWYKEDDKEISENFHLKISKLTQKYFENNMKNLANLSIMHNNSNNFQYYPQNWGNQINSINQMNNMGKNNNMINDPQIGYNMNTGNNLNMNIKNKNNVPQFNNIGNNNLLNNLNINNQNNFNNLNLLNQRKNSTNSNAAENDDRKNQQQQNGKFTCRFELQIENDKEFQVARRLIGAKVIFNSG